jgi:hypothetical protein
LQQRGAVRATFDRNRDAYRAGSLNETEVRVQFLDPLFEALGWDVHNRQGYADAYKDVVHEHAIRMGGHVKAPSHEGTTGGCRGAGHLRAFACLQQVGEDATWGRSSSRLRVPSRLRGPKPLGSDREIDRLVYELYELTDEETRIVEEATLQDARLRAEALALLAQALAGLSGGAVMSPPTLMLWHVTAAVPAA